MGVMRFVVHPKERLTDNLLERVYMSGMDRTPWPGRTRRTPDGLEIERAVSDSGNVHVPWPINGQGEVTLSTGSLMERAKPYLLPVELARGKVNQVRSQLAEWQNIGLATPPALLESLHQSLAYFAVSATSQNNPETACQQADLSLEKAIEAGRILIATYAEQALAVRFRQSPRLPVHLGVHLGSALPETSMCKLLQSSFTAALVPMGWHQGEPQQDQMDWAITDDQLQMCRREQLTVMAGPLLQLDNQWLPDWLYLWEGDYDSLLSFVGQRVENCVRRYKGQVNYWLCASRVNEGRVLSLTEIDKQRLAFRALEVVRQLDPATPALLCFDQPWGEYLRKQELEPPMYFADLLARSGIGLAGLGLEINLGYYPGGTYPRDLVDLNQLLDRWSIFGLPLHLFLTAPSSDRPDPLAFRPTQFFHRSPTQATQNELAQRLLPLLFAKPMVQGIYWNQLTDHQPHDFAHGGLFDAADSPKALLTTLAGLRRSHLT